MEVQKLMFILPIAILYSVFFSKLQDVLTNRASIDAISCSGADDGCYDRRSLLVKNADTAKFNHMMVIGMMGILFGVMMQGSEFQDGKLAVAGRGIAAGGMLTLCYYILMNWSDLGEFKRLFISGTVLAGLVYGSYCIFNSIEFNNAFNNAVSF